jgi:hypothetical protein
VSSSGTLISAAKHADLAMDPDLLIGQWHPKAILISKLRGNLASIDEQIYSCSGSGE